MAIVTNRTLFLHIPKTGGMWVKRALEVGGVAYQEIGTTHEHFPQLLQKEEQSFFSQKFIYTFVRHPLTWYQSRWAFRIKHGWQLKHPLDYNAASNDFRIFVDNVLNYKPDGWCSWLFSQYIDTYPLPIHFIGKMENLVDDFLQVMLESGESINEDKVRAIEHINHSRMDNRGSSYWARYTYELLDRVVTAEEYIINAYYRDMSINPNDLCGPLPY